MDGWLKAALDYVPRWIELQQRHFEQPGCAVAIAHGGQVVLDEAFGVADMAAGERLTPRHRFRVASHSKTFTATGILLLKERGRLRLDDSAGSFVEGLHPGIAAVTLAQLLSHSAGVVRDGADAGQFTDRRPFLNEAELRAGLAEPPPIESGMRFKYSNHGYGLLGLVIEAVTGERYTPWIMREVVEAVGLQETRPDIRAGSDDPLAHGHSATLPLGKRVVIRGENPTHAMASATGFVSTASDLARFFAQLSPTAKDSVLSVGSRREMTRRHWRDEESKLDRYYGLGTISGQLGEWPWFGHSGGFQGTLTRTAVFPAQDISVSVLTNAIDGLAHLWLDGVGHILTAFSKGGEPAPEVRDWTGRWWNMWSPVDFVATGKKVLAGNPLLHPPLSEVSEITVADRDAGRVARASGFASPGESVRRVRGPDGNVSEVWMGGGKLVGEDALKAEMTDRYAKRSQS